MSCLRQLLNILMYQCYLLVFLSKKWKKNKKNEEQWWKLKFTFPYFPAFIQFFSIYCLRSFFSFSSFHNKETEKKCERNMCTSHRSSIESSARKENKMQSMNTKMKMKKKVVSMIDEFFASFILNSLQCSSSSSSLFNFFMNA